MTRSRALVGLLAVLTALGSLTAAAAPADLPDGYERTRAKAERSYAEGSYARARQLYERLGDEQLPAAEARWVEFRVADTSWRAQAGSGTHDNTVFEKARRRLETLIEVIQRPEDRDLVWAEANESLGDFWWVRRNVQNWGQGWGHYQKALDWWAGHRDLRTARRRYLDMVWRMADPPWRSNQHWYYHNVPLDVLENARTIARDREDRARAHYLLAMGLKRYGGSWPQRRRIETEFEAALQLGAVTPWYDDALFNYAQWMAGNGRVTRAENGQWRQEPDFIKAVELYRRLTREFRKGQTRYYDQARNQIKQITEPQVSATVSSIFLPNSEVQFDLQWRNLGGVDLALYRVDLTRDVDPTMRQWPPHEWVWHIDPAAGQKVKAWRHDTRDTGEHKWGRASVRVDQQLPIGAYLLVATAGGKTARDLVLVTDLAIVLKAWRGKVIAYACDAIDGSPVPHARLHLWTYKYKDKVFTGSDHVEQAGDDGLCRFEVDSTRRNRESYLGYLVTAAIDGRQAFAIGGGFSGPNAGATWKIYAATDRPAYRPLETVEWKITARTNDGSGYATPGNQRVHYQIDGPRGKLDEGVLELNAFGTAWTSLQLGESAALGEYQVTFWTKHRNHRIGNATLFRIEEYKLPEFEVTVSVSEDAAGHPKAFTLGETVEARIEASYYFGGPVAGANVEVLVYQKPFYHRWSPPRDYPWLYENTTGFGYWGGQGSVVKRETLRTDADGRVTVSFETPAGGGQDYEYRIEARVTDASRREIIGQNSVRVTRQRYYVYPKPLHKLYSPGDTVEIDFKTIDANNTPVSVEGTVKVTRERWVEIWIDPTGHEIGGWALRDARRRFRVFPPPPEGDGAPWRPKFRGYTSEEILTRTIRTDAEGEAVLAFRAREEGYYRVRWRSEDAGVPITAETTVWVADRKSTDLGYHHGGVEIIIDKDTFRAGQDAAIMLSVPTNDRWVLFSVEGDDLHDFRLVHVTGSVKLIQVPIRSKHIPNVYLNALMVSDGKMYADREQVIVPPVDEFLDVEVVADREAYQPGDEGSLTVFTRDVDGNPVSCEVALSLVDESVFYIQQPYAGDPRQFFYDRRQATHIVQSISTFNHKNYLKLVEGDDDELVIQYAWQLDHDGRRNEAISKTGMNRSASPRGGGFGGGGRMDDLSMPAAAVVEEAEGMFAFKARASAPAAPMVGADQGGPQQAVVVRTDFRSTIFWKPDIVTDETGRATVRVRYADSLTRWKATACAATTGSRFGMGNTVTRTRQPLMARLQAPRFFVVGDTVTISGLFNNNTAKPMKIRPVLEATGIKLTAIVKGGRPANARLGTVTIPARGETRIDWQAVIESPGVATLRLVATGDGHHDAMEKTYTIHAHGVEKFLARGGKVRGEAVTFTLDIPERRQVDTTVVNVTIASSMAVTMLDALPYLVNYPYGCTEQTMSRFLPAVITARTLDDLGLSADDALGKVFGGIERAFVDKTHPKGAEKRKNLRKLDLIVNQGLERLYDFQHGDGGWGWWKGGESDHFMTAYVLWGLSLARDAAVDVRGHSMERAARFLELEIVEAERSHDLQAWMLHALAVYGSLTPEADMSPAETQAMANLWKHRARLNAYSRALLALAAHHYGDEQKAAILVRNLENGVHRDDAPDTSILLGNGRQTHAAVIGTAHWGSDGIFWRWSDGGVEATAFALRALLAIEPDHELVEPVTNWLIKNRRGGQWSNTRDTAITVLALNDYLRVSGELEPQFEYDLIVNGVVIASRTVTAADALSAPSRFTIDPEHIRSGLNEFKIVRRNGAGPIYFAAEATFFSLEEPVPPAGNEIFVRRDYYKLIPRETLLKGYVYDRVKLDDGDYVTSGERIEVVVTVEAKNNYEYLIFEDLKPAGFEAVQLTSGEPMVARELKAGAVGRAFGHDPGADADALFAAPPIGGGVRHPSRNANGDFTGRQRWVHQEFRDRKVALFIDKLPEGVWRMTYDLRAEIPGRFHALPVLGHAMYVPEIRCNSGEIRITVNDRPEAGIVAVGD